MTGDAVQGQPTSPKAPTSVRVSWALALSLAVNLLVIGFVIGAAVWWQVSQPPSGRGGVLRSFAETLDGSKRDEVLEIIRRQRQSLRPIRQAARAARRRLFVVLSAETFDADAFARAQQEAIDGTVRARSSWVGLIPQIAVKLDRVERERLARMIRSRMRRRR